MLHMAVSVVSKDSTAMDFKRIVYKCSFHANIHAAYNYDTEYKIKKMTNFSYTDTTVKLKRGKITMGKLSIRSQNTPPVPQTGLNQAPSLGRWKSTAGTRMAYHGFIHGQLCPTVLFVRLERTIMVVAQF
jgi:hypothetical protein